MVTKIIKYIIPLFSTLGLFACGGGTSGSGDVSDVVSYPPVAPSSGSASFAQSSPLYGTANPNSIQIPIYNNSTGSATVLLGDHLDINPNPSNLSVDASGCINKTLASGQFCLITLKTAGSAQAVPLTKVSLSMPINNTGSVSTVVAYQGFGSNLVTTPFISIPLATLVANPTSPNTLVSVAINNPGSSDLSFINASVPLGVALQNGSGNWNILQTNCSSMLLAYSSCSAILNYSNASQNSAKAAQSADMPLSLITLSADFDKQISIRTNLAVQEAKTNGTSEIDLNPLTFSGNPIVLPIQNSGTIPAGISAKISGNQTLVVDDSACSKQALGSGEICNLIISPQNFIPGSQPIILEVDYKDVNGTHSAKTNIGISAVTAAPGNISFLGRYVGVPTTTIVILTNITNSTTLINFGFEPIANPELTIDEAGCANNNLAPKDSCPIKVTYTPTRVDPQQNITINLNAEDQKGNKLLIPLKVTYSSLPLLQARWMYCLDSACNESVESVTFDVTQAPIGGQGGVNKIMYAKNYGEISGMLTLRPTGTDPHVFEYGGEDTCSVVRTNPDEICTLDMYINNQDIANGTEVLHNIYYQAGGDDYPLIVNYSITSATGPN